MSAPETASKIQHGQFYTTGNPFNHPAFKQWLQGVMITNDYDENTPILEPFSGANHIIKNLYDAGFTFNNWGCYDLEPNAITDNVTPEFQPIENDSIKNYPQGYPLCVTNPPYLAKNSAKRKGYDIDFKDYADLYQVSLHEMLKYNDYIAVIIPESFITSRSSVFLRKRCSIFISLTTILFDDTEHPVCLALFDMEEAPDITVYSGEEKLGLLSEIQNKADSLLTLSDNEAKKVNNAYTIRFNDPAGEISFRGIDGTKNPTIEFDTGDKVAPERVKQTSRSLTRISVSKAADKHTGLFSKQSDNYADTSIKELDLDKLITDANKLINDYRESTGDVFMTSFKGIRKDGKYRRRLDFATARKILMKVTSQQQCNISSYFCFLVDRAHPCVII